MSPFVIKEKIDRYIYSLFNLLSDASFFLKFKTKAIVANNRPYAAKHFGQRCFIVGTGPSILNLSDSDIKMLAGETVFAVNFFYKSEKLSDITPSYYLLMDNLFWSKFSDSFDSIQKKYVGRPPVFITNYRAKHLIQEGANGIFLYAKNYPTDNIRYDISKNVSITMNVVGTAILCALYMGFKEIYLLGCDYNSFCARNQLKTHCYDDTRQNTELPAQNLSYFLKYYHLTTEFHYKISDLAKKRNVAILNLTETSLLDAYEFSSLREIKERNTFSH